VSLLTARSWLNICAAVAAALSMGVMNPASVSAAPSSASAGSSRWVKVAEPRLDGANSLNAVEAFGSRDAWAVGGHGVTGTGGEKPLAAHWDGQRWTRIDFPGSVPLHDVAGNSGKDVWAVGGRSDGSATTVQHWDGIAWSEVVHVGGTVDHPLVLDDVEAVSAPDVWAVGYRGDLLSASGHAQHWNGVEWEESAVPQPEGATTAVLTSVSSFGARNVWASGFAFDGRRFTPYFVRWDGFRWFLVEVPSSIVGGYSAMTMLGPDSFVAVGSDSSPGDSVPKAVVASFADGVWSQVALPITGGELNGVSPDGTGGVWVVGDRVGIGGHDDRHALILRRQGSNWSVVPTPVTEAAGLSDVTVVPGSMSAWSVGVAGVTDESHRSFILGYKVQIPSRGGGIS